MSASFFERKLFWAQAFWAHASLSASFFEPKLFRAQAFWAHTFQSARIYWAQAFFSIRFIESSLFWVHRPHTFRSARLLGAHDFFSARYFEPTHLNICSRVCVPFSNPHPVAELEPDFNAFQMPKSCKGKQIWKFMLTTALQCGLTKSGLGHLFRPLPLWSTSAIILSSSKSLLIGHEMLKISLKSCTKLGSCPRGLNPAPVPAMGRPVMKNSSVSPVVGTYIMGEIVWFRDIQLNWSKFNCIYFTESGKFCMMALL